MTIAGGSRWKFAFENENRFEFWNEKRTSLDLLDGVFPGAEGDGDNKSLGGLVDLNLLGAGDLDVADFGLDVRILGDFDLEESLGDFLFELGGGSAALLNCTKNTRCTLKLIENKNLSVKFLRNELDIEKMLICTFLAILADGLIIFG